MSLGCPSIYACISGYVCACVRLCPGEGFFAVDICMLPSVL